MPEGLYQCSMLNAQCRMRNAQRSQLPNTQRGVWLVRCLNMNEQRLTSSAKPYDIHERLLDFAVEIVNAAQFLHTRGPIGARTFLSVALSRNVGGCECRRKRRRIESRRLHSEEPNRVERGKGVAISASHMSPRQFGRCGVRPARAGIRPAGPNYRQDRAQRLRNRQKRCPTCGQWRQGQRVRSDDESEPRTQNPFGIVH